MAARFCSDFVGNQQRAQSNPVRRLGIWAAIVGVAAALMFLSVPQLDLIVSQLFYTEQGDFVGQSSPIVTLLRYVFIAIFVAACVVSLIFLALPDRLLQRRTNVTTVQRLFAVLCLAIGPGIVTNLTFKEHWGRARPRQIVEFGGQKMFTPPLVVSDVCPTNCSFVSGEAASIFMVFFMAAALFRQHVSALIAAGIAFGGLAGLVRVSQGAHFLSDVVFAGVFMALTVAALQICFDVVATNRKGRLRGALQKTSAVK